MIATYNKKKAEKDHVPALLIERGIRPTRQRLVLATLLFDGMHKHVTAEDVLAMVRRRRERVSLATVYNTLHQFTKCGLLNEVNVDQARSYFDTNVSAHYHFYDEETGKLTDIPLDSIQTECLPSAPDGRLVSRVDVTIRLKKKEVEA
ncbi:MAG: transcriptional repressor [Proteobacteria bacterium]|nr:Fur family transcriptional regulator [Alphaproteobacteria bacterium]NCC03272.1 transcriptional repressor [Pseudomonadota bacterium]